MSYASFVHAQTRFIRRFGRAFIPFWIVVVSLFTLAAAADALWHLGWGYRWQDAVMGLGMIAAGVLFWFLWNWMHKLVSGTNEALFGPDPKREADKQS